MLMASSTRFGNFLKIPETCPNSPIFSIQSSEPKVLAKHLQNGGMMVRAVVPPTVPEGTERVRVCLHAGNSVEQIQALVKSLESWALARTSENNTRRKIGQATEKNTVSARL